MNDDLFAEMCRNSLGAFACALDSTYTIADHVEILIQVAEFIESGEWDRVQVNLPPRHSKPVWEEELVLMGDGSRIPLKEVIVGDYVIGHSGQPCKVLGVHKQGELPCLKISTISGRSCTTAFDHPFLTTRGWIEAGQLTGKDILAVVRTPQTEFRGTRQLSEFILAGYFIGDGGTSRSQRGPINAQMTNADPEVVKDFTEQAEKMGWKVAKGPSKYAYLFSGGVRPWLELSSGLVGNCRTKRVPAWVFRGTKEQISAFIGAYFACDGTVFNKTRNNCSDGYDRLHIGCEFSSTNYGLLSDVQHLLMRLGISSRVKYKPGVLKREGKPDYRTDAWRLTLTSMHETAKFSELIRVVGAKRRKMDGYGILPQLFDSGLFADSISSISLAQKKLCRCLTVEGDQSFTAGDLVVHNSQTFSINLPAWFMGRNPKAKVIVITHGQILADRMGGKIRDAMQTPLFKKIFPDCRISASTGAKNHFETTEGGEFLATTVRGGATGFGADLLIIDDPIKDAIDAKSPTIRLNVIEFYRSVAYPRLMPGGRVLIVLTRWHEGDIAGWLLDPKEQEEVEDWKLCIFPAIAERDEGWRKAGEALWPQKYSLKALQRIKKVKGQWDWAAQYQQQPSAIEGTEFLSKWWRRYHWPPSMVADRSILRVFTKPFRVFQTWDTATEEGAEHDYSVCETIMESEGNFYLLHVYREKINAADLFNVAQDLAAYWCPEAIIIENTTGAKAFIQLMQRHTKLPIIAITPTSDKKSRARGCSPWVESGRVYIPLESYAPWVKDFLNELTAFPTAANDDQVDAFSQFINWITAKMTEEQREEALNSASEPMGDFLDV